jgi:hypothetical protein
MVKTKKKQLGGVYKEELKELLDTLITPKGVRKIDERINKYVKPHKKNLFYDLLYDLLNKENIYESIKNHEIQSPVGPNQYSRLGPTGRVPPLPPKKRSAYSLLVDPNQPSEPSSPYYNNHNKPNFYLDVSGEDTYTNTDDLQNRISESLGNNNESQFGYREIPNNQLGTYVDPAIISKRALNDETVVPQPSSLSKGGSKKKTMKRRRH